MHVTTEAPTADVTPTRTSTILRSHYFLDRFLVAIATILVSIGLTFPRFYPPAAMDRYVNVVVFPCTPAPCPPKTIETSVLDPQSSSAELYVAIAGNYLGWTPIAVALLACGAVAVALEVLSR